MQCAHVLITVRTLYTTYQLCSMYLYCTACVYIS